MSDELPEVLTVEEAAAFLRIGKNQLYEAVGRGEVPHQRIGKTVRLSRSALVLWLSAAQSTAQLKRSRR